MSWMIEEPNFNFLGIPIGSNPRRIKTLSHIIDKFKLKLTLWIRRFLTFVGRITLINSILNSLPTFSLSIYKAPMKVWRDIDKIR